MWWQELSRTINWVREVNSGLGFLASKNVEQQFSLEGFLQ